MFAIIETGGKQYKVSEGDILYIEKLDKIEGEDIKFDKVLAYSDSKGFSYGAPYISGATVTASVVKNGKAKKVYVFRYKPKKDYKKKIGHRQPYTKIQINKISV